MEIPKVYKVGVIGCGFVGTAVSSGFEAILRDSVEIREHDKFKDTESLEAVVNSSDILFICLPTPMHEDGSCDISIITHELEEIDRAAETGKTIVIKSTVPPGTTDYFQEQFVRHTFLFNPEFLTEKSWMNDFITQDRIILGYSREKITKKIVNVSDLYSDFVHGQTSPAKIVWCKSRDAEMLKYTTNAFLSTKVSFFNEIRQICDVSKVNYEEVVKLLKLDKRIGNTHLNVPGPDGKHGFGGSCFPKDLNGLMAFAKDCGIDPLVLESTWAKNLMVREECEWEKLAQVNGKYKK